MRRGHLFLILAAVPAVASATDQPAPPVDAATAKPAATARPRMVCTTEETIGSRLGARKVCRPAGQKLDDATRRDIERMQTNIGIAR